jgi:hypothetical protein
MRSVDIPVKQSDLVDALSLMRVRLDHSAFSARDFRFKHPALRSVSSRITRPIAPICSWQTKGSD